MEEAPYPLIEEEPCKFDSISDVPLFLCKISIDSTEFLVYNIENNKICARLPNPVPYTLQIRGFSCNINGFQLFWFGGASQNGDIVGVCLLIDIKTQSVEILSFGRPRALARACLNSLLTEIRLNWVKNTSNMDRKMQKLTQI
ncbi:unnamed protein product [Blepharisma stoltei]|uniref:Uncharacterized protein n=1 Tax=Blepharisma stoltei TaxID=1481888 RepID=A0AAU9JD67_9CILI|nr:unnamed protein product [Blepharisma stoltei]